MRGDRRRNDWQSAADARVTSFDTVMGQLEG